MLDFNNMMCICQEIQKIFAFFTLLFMAAFFNIFSYVLPDKHFCSLDKKQRRPAAAKRLCL